jgi:N-acetylglucosamine-6-phosphate deacetylase
MSEFSTSEALQFAISASRVFDGNTVHENAAVIIDGSRIAAIMPLHRLPNHVPVKQLPAGAWLAPGFIDIQVNGGGDVLFNDDPSPEAIRTILAAHRRFGTTAMLPTLISDNDEKMRRAAAAVGEAMQSEPGVLGIHFEGPFLSPERPGVHDPKVLRRPGESDVRLLTSLRHGKTLVTLAPECVPAGFVAQLCRLGCVVSLGHSMATYEQTRAAMAEGLTGFTHLFNAMPAPTAREPGPIAAALESAAASYSLIVDGVHVAPGTLRLVLRGAGTPILITDAMPPVGGRKTDFSLYGNTITVANGRCTRADGTLAGAVLDMSGAVRNCVSLLGLPLPLALALASAAPAKFLGLGDVLGHIVPGHRADLVAVEPEEVQILETWVAGKPSETRCAA